MYDLHSDRIVIQTIDLAGPEIDPIEDLAMPEQGILAIQHPMILRFTC